MSAKSDSTNQQSDITPSDNESQEKKYQLSSSEYLELAKDHEGNRNALQKAVDEAAKKAGYAKRWYHGSNNANWTVFDLTKAKRGSNIFLSDKGTASQYANTAAIPVNTRLINKNITTIDDAINEALRLGYKDSLKMSHK